MQMVQIKKEKLKKKLLDVIKNYMKITDMIWDIVLRFKMRVANLIISYMSVEL